MWNEQLTEFEPLKTSLDDVAMVVGSKAAICFILNQGEGDRQQCCVAGGGRHALDLA